MTRMHGATGALLIVVSVASAAAAQNTSPSTPAPNAGPAACAPDRDAVRCHEEVVVRAEAAPSPAAPVTFSSFSSDELRAFGPDTQVWIEIAKQTAGAAIGTDRVYANGVPIARLPPAALVSRVTVNRDPFSVERSGVDELRVDLDLSAPDRRWRFNAGVPSFDRGGANPLVAGGRRPEVRNASGALGGPVASLPLTFWVATSRSAASSQDAFVSPSDPRRLVVSDAIARSSLLTNAAAELVYSSKRVVVHTLFTRTRLSLTNGGFGGLVAPEAGYDSTTATNDWQTTWTAGGERWRHRGGLSWRGEDADQRAVATGAAVVMPGQSTSGGNTIAGSRTRQRALTVSHVVDTTTARRPALFGFSVTTDEFLDDSRPNANGRLQLERAGDVSGVRFVSTRLAPARARTSTASLFAQKVIASSRSFTARAGARADWQQDEGVLLSPRVAATASVASVQLSAGAGVFADAWPADLLAEIYRRDGSHELTRVFPDSEVEGPIPPIGGVALTSRLSDAFRRRRDLVATAAVRRQVGRVQLGVEHTWTTGFALGGSTRERTGEGFADTIASDRRLTRRQLHVQARLMAGRIAATGNYEYARSFDDTAGLFALPARPGDVGGEWARSNGIAAHRASIVTTLTLPGNLPLSATVTWRSGLPHNVITGRDADGLFTFTDRGGLPRNAGAGPPIRNVSVFISRRMPVARSRDIAVDIAARIDNVFGRVNTTAVGSVAGTPVFGQPLGAMPARSLRVWIALAR